MVRWLFTNNFEHFYCDQNIFLEIIFILWCSQMKLGRGMKMLSNNFSVIYGEFPLTPKIWYERSHILSTFGKISETRDLGFIFQHHWNFRMTCEPSLVWVWVWKISPNNLKFSIFCHSGQKNLIGFAFYLLRVKHMLRLGRLRAQQNDHKISRTKSLKLEFFHLNLFAPHFSSRMKIIFNGFVFSFVSP